MVELLLSLVTSYQCHQIGSRFVWVTRVSTHWHTDMPLNYKFSNSYEFDQGEISSALPVKLPSGECHKTSLMISQNGSDFGLVLSGNGPLPEPMLTEIYVDTRPRWVDSVNIQFCAKPLPMLIDIYEARRHSFEGSFHWEVIQVSTTRTSEIV